MRFRSVFSRAFCSLVLVSALSAAALADTIHLKGGGIIKGRITSFNNGKFVVEVGEGSRTRQLTFTASEIESITFDSPTASSTKTTNVPASYTKPEPITVTPPKVIVTDKIVTTNPVPAPIQTQKQTQPPQQQPKPSVSGTKTQPIEWNTKVLADNTANGWTNSGWVVKKGQRIRVTGDGTVSLGKGQNCSPSGSAELEDQQKLMKSVPTGALIAVIGDDNNEFLYIGAEREFTATRDGALFLGVNEGNLNDNSGAFNVKIEIIPDK